MKYLVILLLFVSSFANAQTWFDATTSSGHTTFNMSDGRYIYSAGLGTVYVKDNVQSFQWTNTLDEVYANTCGNYIRVTSLKKQGPLKKNQEFLLNRSFVSKVFPLDNSTNATILTVDPSVSFEISNNYASVVAAITECATGGGGGSGDNIYNTDGDLTGNRTLRGDGNNLSFIDIAILNMVAEDISISSTNETVLSADEFLFLSQGNSLVISGNGITGDNGVQLGVFPQSLNISPSGDMTIHESLPSNATPPSFLTLSQFDIDDVTIQQTSADDAGQFLAETIGMFGTAAPPGDVWTSDGAGGGSWAPYSGGGPGVNIYNGNGVLTGDRTLTGDGYDNSLTLEELSEFTVHAANTFIMGNNAIYLNAPGGGIFFQDNSELPLYSPHGAFIQKQTDDGQGLWTPYGFELPPAPGVSPYSDGDILVYNSATKLFEGQAPTSSTTIYTGNSSLTSDRTVDQDGYMLTFSGGPNFIVNAGASEFNSTVGDVGITSAEDLRLDITGEVQLIQAVAHPASPGGVLVTTGLGTGNIGYKTPGELLTLIGGVSGNIYTTSGTLTGNRILDGSGSNYNLSMTNMGAVAVSSVSTVTLTGTSGSSINGGSSTAFIATASQDAEIKTSGSSSAPIGAPLIKTHATLGRSKFAPYAFPSTLSAGDNGKAMVYNSGTGAFVMSTLGSGTVTNFSAGDLSPLFTTTETNTTTTPALAFSLTDAPARTVFGNAGSSSAAPSYFTPILSSTLFRNQGATNQVLHGNAAGNPTWSLLDLSSEITGSLPLGNISQGGAATGQFLKWTGGTWAPSDLSTPGTKAIFEEDFGGVYGGSTGTANYGWLSTGGTLTGNVVICSSTENDANHPGISILESGGSGSGTPEFHMNAPNIYAVNGLIYETVVKVSGFTASNSFLAGLENGFDKIEFLWNGSGNIELVCTNDGTTTTTNTGVAEVDGSWVAVKFVINAGGVQYYINNTLVGNTSVDGTVAAGPSIPSDASGDYMRPYFRANTTTASAFKAFIDYMRLEIPISR